MNGISSRGVNGFDGRPQLLRPLGAPKGPAPVDGYRQDSMNRFQPDKPRFNSMNTERMQSSVPVDLKDPVQVHLLTETALYDSKEYEILSQEDVDELKKEVLGLNEKIAQTRSNLAIQSKYRDAAISMARLYSPATPKRKSLLGNRTSNSSSASEVELERDAILKKCEELASELWNLERQVIEPQRRLLEHTAGILQLAHKTPGKNKNIGTPTPKATLLNGIPASPESMYTTSNGRNSMELDDVLLSDGDSWTRSFDDALNAAGSLQKNSIEIPLKSPVREQHKQLTVESERLREENESLKQEADSLRRQTASLGSELEEVKQEADSLRRQTASVGAELEEAKQEADSLRRQTASVGTELEGLRQEGTNQWRLISDTERKLEMFNNQLRQVIVTADPAKNGNYANPPSGRLEPGDLIGSHLDYLEKAVVAVGNSQGNSSEATEVVRNLNATVRDLLLANNTSSYPDPPVLDAGLDEQATYMRGALSALGSVITATKERTLASTADRQKGEQNEAILMGLWDIIQAGYIDIQQRNQDRRRTRIDQGFEQDDEDMSDTEAFDPNEKYSISAFSTKVQWLFAEATKLKEQKVVLKRQIKQQRELNNKSDGEKDEALRTKVAELEQSRGALERAEKDVDDVRRQLSDALANFETAKNTANQAGQEQSAAVKEAQNQLKERSAQVSALEASTQEMQMRLSAAEANIATITAQLKEANDAKSEADKQVEAQQKEIKDKEKELDEMTGMMAEFKMEATLAKAELDGAYGSRRERAADAAALYNGTEQAKLQAKVDRLQPRIDELEKELKGTVQDLKDITKQAIDAESKIADLESELDQASQQARKDKEQLQDALDQERLKATAMPLSPSGRPNASILTDSYRDALRSERKKHDEQLKNEQMNRRKVEEELRQLRKAMGPGKSPLSPK